MYLNIRKYIFSTTLFQLYSPSFVKPNSSLRKNYFQRTGRPYKLYFAYSFVHPSFPFYEHFMHRNFSFKYDSIISGVLSRELLVQKPSSTLLMQKWIEDYKSKEPCLKTCNPLYFGVRHKIACGGKCLFKTGYKTIYR